MSSIVEVLSMSYPMKYKLLVPINYYSKRYKKWVRLPIWYLSDGATGVKDIKGPVYCLKISNGEVVKKSEGWWVHDKLCDTHKWADGTPATNWQASMVLRDIMWGEGRWFRAHRWMVGTFLYGIFKY
jgi:hypothetical protein